ncbi:MAG: response regulator [Deltaproteobacteria bacterium]|nr:response regulator [Deltaproteobacteria bacterium]
MAKIWIIEPDPSLASSLSDAVMRAGMLVEVLSEGMEVLEALASDPPGLIVLDLSIGGNRGVDLCHAIRDSAGGDLVPILMLGTGQEGVASFGDALAEGGDYYFEKPVDPDQLISKIRTYVGVDREASTVVGAPPVSSTSADTSGADALPERVEQMLDLGAAFKDGLLAPPQDPEPGQGSQPDEPSAPPGSEAPAFQMPTRAQESSSLLASQLFDDVDEIDTAQGLAGWEPGEPAEVATLMPPEAGLGLQAEPEPFAAIAVGVEPAAIDAGQQAALLPPESLPADGAAGARRAPAGRADTLDEELARMEQEALQLKAAAASEQRAPYAFQPDAEPTELAAADTVEMPAAVAPSPAMVEQVKREASRQEADALFEAATGGQAEGLAQGRAAAERDAQEQASGQAQAKAIEDVELRARSEAVQEAGARAADDADLAGVEKARQERLDDRGRGQAVDLAHQTARQDAAGEARKKAFEQAKSEAIKTARGAATGEARQAAAESAQRDSEQNAGREAARKAQTQAAEQMRRAEAKARQMAVDKARKQSAEKAEGEATQRAKRDAVAEAGERAGEDARDEALRDARDQAPLKARLKGEQAGADKAAGERLDTETRARKEAGRLEGQAAGREAAEQDGRTAGSESAEAEAELAALAEARKDGLTRARGDALKRAEEKALSDLRAARRSARARREKALLHQTREKGLREGADRAGVQAERKARAKAEEDAGVQAGRKANNSAREQAIEQAQRTAQREVQTEARGRAIQKLRAERAESVTRQELEHRIREELEQRIRREYEERFPEPESGPEESPPKAIEPAALWEEALEEFDTAGTGLGSMARLAANWVEDRLSAGPDELPDASRPMTRRAVGSEQLLRLLEREASMARERASQAPEDEGDLEQIITMPDLPKLTGREGEVDPGRRAQERLGLREVEQAMLAEPPSLRLVAEPSSPVEKQSPRAAAVEREPVTDFFAEPPPPVLQSPEPEACDLAQEPVPAVLWRLHAQRVTGLLSFQSRNDEKGIFFEGGVPVGVRSSLRADRFEEMLLREGLIDREAYAEARVKGLIQARALAAHLVERGLLMPDELYPAVRRHLESCILGLFEWTQGKASYQPRLADDGEKVRLSRPLPALILDGIRHKYLLERMVRELGGASTLIAPVPVEDRAPGAPEPSDLALSARELEILRLVNGLRPIEEIAFLSGQDPTKVYQVLTAGVVMGLLAVVVRGLASGAKGEAEALRRDIEIRRRRALAKFEQINQVNYFEFLGVSEEATPYEVQQAHERLSREFHPLHYRHPGLKDLEKKLQIVRRSLDEALGVLADDLLRKGYRESLREHS